MAEATETTIAMRVHVAGPPEKRPADSRAGWEWSQSCLTCDMRLDTGAWWLLGARIYELADGRLTTEPPPGSGYDTAPRCLPED